MLYMFYSFTYHPAAVINLLHHKTTYNDSCNFFHIKPLINLIKIKKVIIV
jgi:hypothetical protein